MLKLKLQYAAWCEEPMHCKRPWCWERLRAGEQGWQRMRWLDGITQLSWVWVNSGKQWRTGTPDVLQSMGWKRDMTDQTIIVTYGWLFSRGQLFPWHFLQPFILVLWSWSKFSSFDNSCFADFMALGFCGQVRRKEQESYRKGNPFQSSKGDSCLTLRNELSKETHLLTKQETLLGRNAQAEARMVREPGRTTLPRDSQSRVLCWWNWFPDCLWLIILTQGPSWWCMHCSAKVDVNKKASGTW